MRRRICVVTGSRAEYGLLFWVLYDLRAAQDIELQLIVTGMHLAPEFGLTVSDIERDEFEISRRVDMLISGDSPSAAAKSIGVGVIGLSDAFEGLSPDLVLVLGDRFEILSAVQACLIHKIPVAHIAGGDTTEGAFDESIRHAITKMAHLHLVTNELSARRVLQLGEDPRHVHIVGSPGLDHLRRATLMNRAELEQALQAPLGRRNLLVTFHPVTLDADHGLEQVGELIAALDAEEPGTIMWVTRPNADPGGRGIAAAFDAWADKHKDRVRIYTSLGQVRYLSLMAQVDAIVGNSSSGLYEAPSFQIPTINVGDRQRGRLAATSVVNCEPTRDSIREALRLAETLDCQTVLNPYGDGQSAGRIVDLLRSFPLDGAVIKKSFHLREHAPA